MIPILPAGISGRVLHISGFTGWDHLLEFLPQGWRLKLLARRLMGLGALAVGEHFVSPGDGCWKIVNARGCVERAKK